MSKPSLIVSPLHSYIDEELTIKVTGCLANQAVTIRARTKDDSGKLFHSFACFPTNEHGEVHVANTKPIEGTYKEADGSGLFWSMERSNSKNKDYFEKTKATLLSIELELEADGNIVDTVTIERHFYQEDVKRVPLTGIPLTGMLYHPIEDGAYPGVLLLGGSDGGIQEHAAALLASKGYSVLALAYFGTKDVAKDLENIPLEYFKEATDWLKRHHTVDKQVTVIGYSRGGELALLLGATFDDYAAIIAGAPSAYVTSGLKNNIFAPTPSWTFDQEPLDYMKFKYQPRTMLSIWKNWLLRRPVSFLSIWDNTLSSPEKLTSSRIAIEHIKVPVMTISGDDDQLWPSSYYSKIVENELTTETTNSHLYYQDAGHFLSFPYSLPGLPANQYMQVGAGMMMTFGGTKAANAKAAIDSWPRILAFLKEHTKKPVCEKRC